MEKVMRTRAIAILPLIPAIAVSLWAGPLAAQTSPTPTCTPNLFTIPEASRGHGVANEVYAPSVTAAVYLVNFLLLYMAKPDLAAYMPAYRAPILQPVVDCLEQNPTGCPYADYRRYFDEQAFDNRECFWPDVCQENARWASLAPRKVRQPEQINEPLGRRRADQLAHLLGMDEGMILTDAEYHCVIGTPPRPQTERRSSVASITLLTRTETQPFPFPATGLTSVSREMFEVFARPVRRVSSSTSCLAGPWRQFSQSADAWRSFCGWKPKRRFFSSSKMRIPARNMANPLASSKPPAQETDTREEAAPTRFATT